MLNPQLLPLSLPHLIQRWKVRKDAASQFQVCPLLRVMLSSEVTPSYTELSKSDILEAGQILILYVVAQLTD